MWYIDIDVYIAPHLHHFNRKHWSTLFACLIIFAESKSIADSWDAWDTPGDVIRLWHQLAGPSTSHLKFEASRTFHVKVKFEIMGYQYPLNYVFYYISGPGGRAPPLRQHWSWDDMIRSDYAIMHVIVPIRSWRQKGKFDATTFWSPWLFHYRRLFRVTVKGKEYLISSPPTKSNAGLQAVDKESAAVLSAFTVRLFFCVDSIQLWLGKCFRCPSPSDSYCVNRLREKHLCKVNMFLFKF